MRDVDGTKGILYIAIGEKYINQAILSAKITKSNIGSDINITLVTTEPVECPYIDQVKPVLDTDIESDRLIKQSKVSGLLETPYEKTLYMDTDAYVIENVDEIFEMLETIDLALAIDPTEFGLRHLNMNPDDIPNCFPEYDTAVIAYKNKRNVQSFIQDWKTYHSDASIERDQVSFRATLFRNSEKIKFSCLSKPLYNHSVALTQRVENEVKIIHDSRDILKNHERIENYSNILNETHQERIIFGPGYGPNKFYAPHSPKKNTILSALNSALISYNMCRGVIKSIRNHGLLATIQKMLKRTVL